MVEWIAGRRTIEELVSVVQFTPEQDVTGGGRQIELSTWPRRTRNVPTRSINAGGSVAK